MAAPSIKFRNAFERLEYARRLRWICEDLDRIIRDHPNTRLVIARAMLRAQAVDAACADPRPAAPAEVQRKAEAVAA